MTATVRKIRTTGYGDPRVDQLARDVEQRFAQMMPFQIVKVTDNYAEPMRIAFDHEPQGVVLVRLCEDDDPEDPQYAYALVPFTYRDGAVEIPEVVGPALGTRYRFTFWMVG